MFLDCCKFGELERSIWMCILGIFRKEPYGVFIIDSWKTSWCLMMKVNAQNLCLEAIWKASSFIFSFTFMLDFQLIQNFKNWVFLHLPTRQKFLKLLLKQARKSFWFNTSSWKNVAPNFLVLCPTPSNTVPTPIFPPTCTTA